MSREKIAGYARQLTRYSILLIFFLTPLIFAPFTTEALEMNKQLVFVSLVFLATIGLLGQWVVEQRISWRGGRFLSVIPCLFLVTILLSAIWSLTGVEAWFGYGGQEYVSFLTAAAGVIWLFVMVQVSDTSLVKQALLALLVSSSLISLLALCSLVDIYPIPYAFTQTAGFNTIGNINAMVAWLIPVTLAGLGTYLMESKQSTSLIPNGQLGAFVRGLISFVSLTTVFMLAAIDFWTLWTAFIVGLLALLALSFLAPSHFVNRRRLALPVTCLAVACLFLFIKTPLRLQVPVVVSPSINSSWEITQQVWQQGLTPRLFGSGPGSFDLDFARYRPVEVNTTIFWNTRFDRAQIHPLTVLATNGMVGFAGWVLLILLIASLGCAGVMTERHRSEWQAKGLILVAWLALTSLHLLTPLNMSLIVLWWGLSGLLLAEVITNAKNVSFAQAPRLAMATTSSLAIFAIAGGLTLVALGSRHSAEIAFAKAARLDAADSSALVLIEQMSKAVTRDPSSAVLARNLSTAYLARAQEVVSESLQDNDFSQADKQALSDVAGAAIAAAAQAATLGPNDSLNWATNGLIYRELMPFIENAQNYAASMYVKALEFEPNNPAYQTDLGRVYLAVADRASEVQKLEDLASEARASAVVKEVENLRIAAVNLEQAIAFKSDYAPAHYYLAATYERQGKLDEAANRLKALAELEPSDIGLGFQLAVIYLKMEELEVAATEFERVLGIFPDYSNAMWYLAAIKANAGDTESALRYLRRVLELNPESVVVLESIANLEAGVTAPADPGPIEPLDTPASLTL